jgi:putative membrane protein
MLMSLLIRLVLTALAFVVTAWLLSGMELSGGFFGALWVALLFGVINTILGTIIRLLTFPLILLTLGLFAVLINALMLQLTDAITSHLTIDEFWWTAIWAALLLSIVTVVLEVIVGVLFGKRSDDARPAVPA